MDQNGNVYVTGSTESTDFPIQNAYQRSIAGHCDAFITKLSEITYTLTITKSGSGSGTVTSSPARINCGDTCSASFGAGTRVTLTAVAVQGSDFIGWGGSCSACNTNATCQITINSDKTCSAEFETTNQPPVIDSFTANPTSGEAPLAVTFTCQAHDPDGSIVSYHWDFDGDGNTDQTTTMGQASYTYNAAGTYPARVTVEDDQGASTTSGVKTISVYEGGSTILTLGSRSGSPDSTVSIPVTLSNNSAIVSLQFDVVFDSGTLENGDEDHPAQVGSALQGTSFSVSSNVVEPGRIRVIIVPPLQNPLPTIPNGEIVTLPIHIKADVSQGTIETLSFDNVTGSDENNNSVDIAAVPGELIIAQYTPGDANGDGQINVQDVISIINHILLIRSAQGNPDCNGDGTVNVQDVICVINKILTM